MTLAFNLPNDDVLVTRFGTAQVMMKNVSAAKFEHIMLPLARACLAESLVSDVTFDAFFTHTLCHELCHGIGPHTLTLESGTSSVRERIGTDHSALEEAKADVVVRGRHVISVLGVTLIAGLLGIARAGGGRRISY